MLTLRKVLALLLVSTVTAVLAVQFAWLVEPAVAREARAACTGLVGAPASKTIPSFPAPALEFTAHDHTGKAVSLSDFRGKVVLVNFWASWCGTCEVEKPSLVRMQRELASDDLVVLALASDVGWDPIRAKYPQGMGAKVLLDKVQEEQTYGPIALAYGIEAVPESFLVDRKGVIRHYFINKRDWDSDVAKTCLRSIIDE